MQDSGGQVLPPRRRRRRRRREGGGKSRLRGCRTVCARQKKIVARTVLHGNVFFIRMEAAGTNIPDDDDDSVYAEN